jgi:integrase
MPRLRASPRQDKKTGVFYFDQIIGFGDGRQRIRSSLRTRDFARAQWLWEQEYKKRWAKYYGLETEKPKPISFVMAGREFLAYQRDVKKIKEWKTVRDRLNIIDGVWGNVNLHEISKQKLVELDQFLKENARSPSTINHYFALLKTFFNFAIRKKMYNGENPVNEFQPYIADEKRRAYSQAEIGKIIDATERIEKEARQSAELQQYAKRITQLLLFTGMRLGEVLNLRWDNIQEDKIVLKRTETKQKREKVVPMGDEVKRILEELRGEVREDGYVIPLRRKSGKMRGSWADSLIRKIRKYSGIQDFIFHNLRHTASTIMVSEALGKGVSLADVMKILGHSQMTTTLKYIHENFNQMKTAIKILEDEIKK